LGDSASIAYSGWYIDTLQKYWRQKFEGADLRTDGLDLVRTLENYATSETIATPNRSSDPKSPFQELREPATEEAIDKRPCIKPFQNFDSASKRNSTVWLSRNFQ